MCPRKVKVGGGELSEGGRKSYFTKLSLFQELGENYRNKPKTDTRGVTGCRARRAVGLGVVG